MSAQAIVEEARVIVELSCDLCPATVIQTDRVTLDVVSADLSAAGWWMIGDPTDGPQTTLCPRCARAGDHHG